MFIDNNSPFQIHDFSKIEDTLDFVVFDQNHQKKGRLTSLNTTGDGSCGFHAVFGEFNDQLQAIHVEDVYFLRLQFSEYLREKFINGDIPDLIKEALKNYFEEPSDSAPQLQNVLFKREVYELLLKFQNHNFYDEIDSANEVLNELLQRSDIREAYLTDMMGAHHVYPEELAEAANFAGKTLHLYQNIQGEVHGPKIYPSEIIGGETLEVLANGKHFEKAIFYPEK